MCLDKHDGGVSPLWDVYSHPQHLLLEAFLAVTESTSEEEEAGAVSLTLTHKEEIKAQTGSQSDMVKLNASDKEKYPNNLKC